MTAELQEGQAQALRRAAAEQGVDRRQQAAGAAAGEPPDAPQEPELWAPAGRQDAEQQVRAEPAWQDAERPAAQEAGELEKRGLRSAVLQQAVAQAALRQQQEQQARDGAPAARLAQVQAAERVPVEVQAEQPAQAQARAAEQAWAAVFEAPPERPERVRAGQQRPAPPVQTARRMPSPYRERGVIQIPHCAK